MNPSEQYRLNDREVKQIAASLAAAQAAAEKCGRLNEATECYSLRLRLMIGFNRQGSEKPAPVMPKGGPFNSKPMQNMDEATRKPVKLAPGTPDPKALAAVA